MGWLVLLSLVVVFADALAPSAAAGAQGVGPPPVVAAFITAWNARDLDGALGPLTDDAVIGSNQWTLVVGKEAIRAWLRQRFAEGARIDATNFAADGETVTYTFALSDEWSRKAGLPHLEGGATVAIYNGKIRSVTETIDPTSQQRRSAAVRVIGDAQATQVASQMAQATSEASATLLAKSPSTQGRGNPSSGAMVAAALAFAGATILAFRSRSR